MWGALGERALRCDPGRRPWHVDGGTTLALRHCVGRLVEGLLSCRRCMGTGRAPECRGLSAGRGAFSQWGQAHTHWPPGMQDDLRPQQRMCPTSRVASSRPRMRTCYRDGGLLRDIARVGSWPARVERSSELGRSGLGFGRCSVLVAPVVAEAELRVKHSTPLGINIGDAARPRPALELTSARLERQRLASMRHMGAFPNAVVHTAQVDRPKFESRAPVFG